MVTISKKIVTSITKPFFMEQIIEDIPVKGIPGLQIPGIKLTRNEMKSLLRDNPCPDGSDGIGPCIPPPYYPPCPDGFSCVQGIGNGAMECCED